MNEQMVCVCDGSADKVRLDGQEDNSERVNPTKPQQARGGRSDRAEEVVTPWCSSPLLYPPLARNKMACNRQDNSISPDLTQPR